MIQAALFSTLSSSIHPIGNVTVGSPIPPKLAQFHRALRNDLIFSLLKLVEINANII
jgi:hypothetical protein